ncbi:MAG: Rpn family recombination-promoting nuclease/putative transposase [Methylovulum sp.]|nr:Rpn family recombination-promoting nuclease/putative transposase [Methylovulum sp.]
MQDIYINPFTDFGFKKLFGEEPHKDLLISFLNTLLPEKHQIENLHYSKNEYQGSTALDRKAIFDLHCTSASGERFIVELQKAKQNYFKDRSVYYSTFPIQEQAQRGDWDYQLAAVYTVGILDFVFDEDAKAHDLDVIHSVQLKNQHGNVFYDKLTFIYLTLPHFKKTLAQLDSQQDKWLYIFKHLHELHDIPTVLKDSIFLKVFAVAQIAKLSHQEQQAYEDSLKYYRDLKNVTDTAWEEGKLEGLEEGLQKGLEEGLLKGEQAGIGKAVLAMHRQGMSVDFIAATLNLPCDTVDYLISNNQ